LLMAVKLKLHLFLWFSYVSMTATASFFLGWLNLPIDWFYFGMIVFNSALIGFYIFADQQKKTYFFLKDFAKYIPVNLVLTSAFLLMFFETQAFNGFNVLLTAVLYLFIVQITQVKHFHYAFTLLFIYGAYQTIEHSILVQLDALL